MEQIEQKNSLLGSVLLIAGCCIGAGMLGLPVVSSLSGFMPATLAMIVAYFFAVISGLFIVEASLWFDHKVHLLTLAEETLGKWGRYVIWSFFLILFYCLFVAYLSGGGELFASICSSLVNVQVFQEVGVVVCALFVGSIVYLGTKVVSYISRVFFLGIVICYLALVVTGAPFVELSHLAHKNWIASLATIPVLFICFGYQNVIPTVIYYAKKNVRNIRLAIVIGNFIPFLVYTVWNFVILGIVHPTESSKLLSQGEMVTDLLQNISDSTAVVFFAKAFSVFAIITPFLASSLAFVHFLKDGLKRFPSLQSSGVLYGLVLVPPVIFSLMNPHLFLSALSFAGGFIDAVLFGIMPVLMVWSGRYVKQFSGSYQVFGGKLLLAVMFVFSSLVLLYRVYNMIM